MKSLLYRFLRLVVHAVVRVFYRRVEIVGAERIPTGRPLLFVGNHVNAIVDPILISMVTSMEMRFLAKAPLFKTLALGPLLRLTNAIPVYRRDPRDYPGGVVPEELPHDEMFRAAYDTLAQGRHLCLFPEGISHANPRLQELKTGAARILLGAEARNGYRLDVHVVPVGLTFENQGLFRSKVLVQVGNPFSGRACFDLHRSDAAEAVRRLTEDIDRGLHDVTLNFETEAERDFFLSTAEVLHGRRMLNETLFQVVQEWTPVYRRYRDREPAALEAFRAKVAEYLRYRDALGLAERSVGLRASALAPLAFPFEFGPLLALAVVVVPVSLATCVLPFLLCRRAGRREEELDMKASKILLAGFLYYPPAFALWAIAAGAFFGWPFGLAALALVPCLALLAVALIAALARHAEAGRAYILFRAHGKLQQFLLEKRREIVDLLEAGRAAAKREAPSV
ncbi:MAG: 1-acyl-sn-glycerol-3-phosphate acyltransferase [Planctomycetes bacterium]|nr:1-acyl-sn-glycerol-3-phosphate acyltransferase [Planctomycetota bacterium]